MRFSDALPSRFQQQFSTLNSQNSPPPPHGIEIPSNSSSELRIIRNNNNIARIPVKSIFFSVKRFNLDYAHESVARKKKKRKEKTLHAELSVRSSRFAN